MALNTTPYINPYIAGNPVHGDFGFFGRVDILRQVEQILAAPGQSAVILYGPRRIGKTSILLQLQYSLPSDQYTVIYQDLQDKARQPMRDLLAELADEIADDLNLVEPDLIFDDQGRAFQKEFLPRVYNILPNKEQRLVLLFDEFDVLDMVQREKLSNTAAANQLFATLRRWLREESRLAFVFALGRNLEDLDSDFLSTFKGSQTVQVSVFSREDTVALITAPESLRYTNEAIDEVYTLTNGHPYFTQLLCSLCFDRAYGQQFVGNFSQPLMVTVEDVDMLIPTLFSRADNVFAWIWNGLPPAERIVASALAELLANDNRVVTQDEIEKALRNEGIRVIIRDLPVSAEKLVGWQLLQRVDGGYRFLVPLLHQWIRENKPLITTRDEIDRLNPRAHAYFETAKSEYQAGNLEDAKKNLYQALILNSDHLQAQILMGDLCLEQNDFENALNYYEQAYKQDRKQVEGKLEETLRGLENKSKQLFDEGKYGASQEILRRLQKVNPDYQFSIIQSDHVQKMVHQHRRYRILGRLTATFLVIVFWIGFNEATRSEGTPISPEYIMFNVLIYVSLGISALVIAFLEDSIYKDTKFSLKEFFRTVFVAIMGSTLFLLVGIFSAVLVLIPISRLLGLQPQNNVLAALLTCLIVPFISLEYFYYRSHKRAIPASLTRLPIIRTLVKVYHSDESMSRGK